jgi:ATP-binding cassette subfamily C protein
LLAGTRVAPGIFRIQQSLNTIIGAVAATKTTQQLLIQAINGSEPWKSPTPKVATSIKPSNQIDSPSTPIDLIIEDLSFSFCGKASDSLDKVSDEILFESLNFSIPPGESLALIGPSGVGKSTLIDLILGFQTPTKGKVLLNGLPSKEFIFSNPGKVSYVPQKCHLLNDSLLSNITLKNDNTDADYHLALKLIERVQLTNELNALNDGLSTKVGDGSRTFSGGQLQRIAIARALYTKPQLLILDEYTSALDAKNEHQISRLVSEISRNTTVLIVSHRNAAIHWCDHFASLNRDIGSKRSVLRTVTD